MALVKLLLKVGDERGFQMFKGGLEPLLTIDDAEARFDRSGFAKARKKLVGGEPSEQCLAFKVTFEFGVGEDPFAGKESENSVADPRFFPPLCTFIHKQGLSKNDFPLASPADRCPRFCDIVVYTAYASIRFMPTTARRTFFPDDLQSMGNFVPLKTESI